MGRKCSQGLVFETQNIALDLAIFGEHMIVLLCFLRITNVNFPLIISACYSASGFTADVLPNFPDLGHAHGNTAEGSHVVCSNSHLPSKELDPNLLTFVLM